MHDRQLILSKQRLERREARMQPEITIQIDRRVRHATPRLRNRNRRPQPVVVWLREGNYDVQAVGGAALEQHHQLLLVWHRGRRSRALQKRRHRAHPHQRDSTLLQKIPPRKPQSSYALATFMAHKHLMWSAAVLPPLSRLNASPSGKPQCTAAGEKKVSF